jgi:hypothetical protein
MAAPFDKVYRPFRAFLKLSPERAIKYNIGFVPKKYDKRNF